MTDVFISYSRSDHALVQQLARAVEAEGYDVWWDADLPPHQSYGEVITSKIAEAKAAIVVWSAVAAKSEWVRAEADMARNQKKLVQTSIEDVMPPLPFNQIQCAQLADWDGSREHAGFTKVKVSLAELCGSGVAGQGPSRSPRALPPIPAPIPPQRAPEHSRVASGSAKWPLFAGIGVAAVALAMAGGMLIGQRSGKPRHPAVELTATQITPPGPVMALPPPASADMIFADSSTRLLSESEVAMLGPSTLRDARGEIFARKGRRFKNPALQAHFNQFPWYRGRFDEVSLNPIEQRNVELLRRAEARYAGGGLDE